jgi:hypothetical protein
MNMGGYIKCIARGVYNFKVTYRKRVSSYDGTNQRLQPLVLKEKGSVALDTRDMAFSPKDIR